MTTARVDEQTIHQAVAAAYGQVARTLGATASGCCTVQIQQSPDYSAEIARDRRKPWTGARTRLS